MKTLLVCAGGLSTTMMMQEMKKVIKNSEKLNEDDYPMEAIGMDRLEDYLATSDVVLVGPQLTHKYSNIKAKCDAANVPSVLLTAEIYGAMDGATVVKQAIIAYRKANGIN